MPVQNLLTIAAIFALIALFMVFKDRIIGALKRFDARNQARRAEEARALFDGYAHYRQTMELAEEQVEEVQKLRTTDPRTGEAIERYVFEGVQYPTRREAEAARHEAIIGKAREFYMELDKMYLSRRGWREPQGDLPALSDKSRSDFKKSDSRS